MRTESGKQLGKSLGECLIEQFEDLFKSECVDQCPILDVFFQLVISNHENDCFMAIPSGDEILQMVRKMNPTKAPGPNGMPARFY